MTLTQRLNALVHATAAAAAALNGGRASEGVGFLRDAARKLDALRRELDARYRGAQTRKRKGRRP